jgi:hypothetical protein
MVDNFGLEAKIFLVASNNFDPFLESFIIGRQCFKLLNKEHSCFEISSSASADDLKVAHRKSYEAEEPSLVALGYSM